MASSPNDRLIDLVKTNPPINYVMGGLYYQGVMPLFIAAYPEGTPECDIINQGVSQKPKGIVVFGYSDNSVSIEPFTSILKEIGLPFGIVKLEDGREIGFISHSSA
jgi:hypothetical protein